MPLPRRPLLVVTPWLLLAVIGLFLGSPAAAHEASGEHQDVRAVASILPLHSLAASLMAGTGEPTLLIPSRFSPHSYALRPSDARALSRAQAVFWIGETLETFLARPLRNLAPEALAPPLGSHPGIHYPGEGHEQHGEEEAHDHEHGDAEEHNHGDRNPHLWLDPENARVLIDGMGEMLAVADPGHEALYRENAAALDRRLVDLDARIATILAGVKETPFVVFHDAYGHFTSRYGLNQVGVVTLNPERPPGARKLREIRHTLRDSGAVCLFAEPQFPTSLAKTALQGSAARLGLLDPVGADLTPGPDAYFTLVENLARSLADCLSGKKSP